jgi:hypothetical protein
MPVSAKVAPSDLFVKDKYVSEEIRNLAKELDVLMVTASQLNRAAVEETSFDHSHISGGISKINTADNVFGIFTSRAMKERGEYQLQLMKTRSSGGVGSSVALAFNPGSMRISDGGLNTDDDDGSRAATGVGGTGSHILNQIRSANTTVQMNGDGTIASSDDPLQKVKAQASSSKLNSMLNGMKKDFK